MKLFRLKLVLLLALLGTGTVFARGYHGGGYYGDEDYRYLARSYSLDDAVSDARRDHRGKVLSADTVRKGDREVHRVRIINERGRVRGYRYDGETGQPLNRDRR